MIDCHVQPEQMNEARYWLRSGQMMVSCYLCPHRCQIAPGRSGRCQVRQNIDGVLYAAAYGKITAMALDPIEKKPLKYYMPGSKILSAGSYGCNFACDFCQNWSIAQKKAAFTHVTPGGLAQQAKDLETAGNIGLAFTYNEPLINIEYIADCASLIRRQKQKTILVTNGFIEQEPLADILPLIDAMNIDLKAFSADFYQRICKGQLQPVLRTIERASRACHIEITTMLIPGYNDQDDQIRQLTDWLADIDPDIPLHLTRYYPAYKMTEPAPISLSRMRVLAEIARKRLNKIELGNI